MMAAIHQHRELGVAAVCEALGASRASYYRRLQPRPLGPRRRVRAARALRAEERAGLLDVLNSERFVDQPPAQVYATLLDEGEYRCSVRTMYRVLEDNHQVRERRNQLRHPEYKKPELCATAPNQVWSWDITKLLGPEKWTYFYLYVVLDIFSRYVVGWMVSRQENARLAKQLLAEAYAKQGIDAGQLTVHGDRGAPMTSKSLALLLADLGVTKTHSRPRVSNDNPFSEAHFKTLKYRPDFPENFGCVEDVRSFCHPLFDWYNREHRHGSLGLLTPEQVHYGLTGQVVRHRDEVLLRAYQAHPERFPRRLPRAARPPAAAWINPPQRVVLPADTIDVVVPARAIELPRAAPGAAVAGEPRSDRARDAGAVTGAVLQPFVH